ncbi:MAG: NAD(P)/FAD-dependent oxidoreductase, partial [Desulfobulbia bacterium]
MDYLIIGSGLAGISFAEQVALNGRSFIMIDDDSQKSSTVAGGLYNPVILKRFTSVWKSDEQLELAKTFYATLENKLEIKLDHKIPIYRLFNSIEEQNNWFLASDKPRLSRYMLDELVTYENKWINSSYGYGQVLHTGRIDAPKLIKYYKTYLKKQDRLIESSFDHKDLKIGTSHVEYKSITASKVIFAEGFGLKINPFFKDLPLNGSKGELLTIHAPDLKIDFILKAGVFLIPLGDDQYIVGAT